MDDKGTLKGGFSWFPAYRPANAVMIGLRVGFRVQVDTPLLLRTFRVGKVRDSLGQIVWNFGRDFQPCVGFRDYSPPCAAGRVPISSRRGNALSPNRR